MVLELEKGMLPGLKNSSYNTVNNNLLSYVLYIYVNEYNFDIQNYARK